MKLVKYTIFVIILIIIITVPTSSSPTRDVRSWNTGGDGSKNSGKLARINIQGNLFYFRHIFLLFTYLLEIIFFRFLTKSVQGAPGNHQWKQLPFIRGWIPKHFYHLICPCLPGGLRQILPCCNGNLQTSKPTARTRSPVSLKFLVKSIFFLEISFY